MPAREAPPPAPAFDAARALIDAAVAAHQMPAAVAEVGCGARSLWRCASGSLSLETDSPPAALDTIFDLASLTKVIATTTLCQQLVGRGVIALDSAVRELVPGWSAADRAVVTIRHLLDHSSGLPAHVDLFETCGDAAAYEAAICACELAYRPGTRSVYSDLGFILLGFIIERAGMQPLCEQFARVASHLDSFVDFLPPYSLRSRIAPTEFDPRRGRVLRGEVHDENAAALGGVAGHAGLFGTAAAVGSFARAVLATLRETTWISTPEVNRPFLARSGVPGSSRALGWDTMLPTSSCGTLMSPSAVGHTGFTGTSLWIDWERDTYVVLLTNRVHPTRANEALVALRPRVHDAVMRVIIAEQTRRS